MGIFNRLKEIVDEKPPAEVEKPEQKPKGMATVVQDDPIDIFPVDNQDEPYDTTS